MILQVRSFGDLDSLKEGDIIYSPTLDNEGENYSCILEEYKIKNFLAKSVNIKLNDKVNFDKFDVVLERCEDSFEYTTNLRSGFCTSDTEAKKQILTSFKEEIENMASAIDKQIENLN